MRVVIAVGGNAMTAADGSARPQDQQSAIERAVEPIAELICAGHQVVLTHGNGPQVGNLLVKNELAASVVPPVPLDWCGAQTQATVGLLILNALDRALAARNSQARTAVVVSRTEVAADDPAFSAPSKPIGRYLSRADAAVMTGHGQHWQDRGERGWRRVVASPEPLRCLDAPAVVALLAAGFAVVCSGGGGIPVVADGSPGGYRGVEAVIDKDLTAALLADALAADRLVIATDVEHAVLGWGTDSATPLAGVDVDDLEALIAEGAFASGSMAPKVTAACRFTRQSGKPAAITSLSKIADALAGVAGTIVRPAPSRPGRPAGADGPSA
ncbi:MAG TPA: carbamate kinase [Jatrophihabitans sp.]|uniref:carbamate kinase n=1 Tax=Jatrophihabitans sp. TaxID=1932789 RepID=UPI002F107AFF